jgi:TPR repeat protein
MILAIWRANRGTFPGGTINLLEVGTVLAVPSRDSVAAIDAAEADRTVRDMLAKAPAVSVAATASARESEMQPVAPPLGQEEATRLYREGEALERKGDDHGALRAYLEAGEAGHGLAQRRLGQIYDKGNSAVQRDYQASLKWYQKAREQGVEIDKPLPRMTTK